MKNKLIYILLLSVFLFGQKIHAQTLEQKVSLDEKTVIKGYTIKTINGGPAISVKPKSFTSKTNFYIKGLEVADSTINNQKVKSKIYQINFDQKTEKPLLIKLAWQSFSNQPKNIYWRKDQTMNWQQLPSKTEGKETSADIIDAGEVILLEQIPTSLNDVVKYVSARSATVLNADTGEVLYAKNANEVRPIASLTKLMTAMVFLERPAGWQKEINITKNDKDIPVTVGLKDNETTTVKNMWFAMLTKSANDAAKAIARISGLNTLDFVKRMNSWAKELDLKKSSFADPSGLNPKNVSTAMDTAIMARAAFTYPDILQATGTKETKITTNTNREIAIKNSTTLFDSDLKIDAAKTGYTTEAGRCQIIRARGDLRNVIVVVLGSGSGRHTTDAYDLGNWFANN